MENVWFEDVTADVIADDDFMFAMDHYDAMRNELGFKSIWSMYDMGCKDKNWAMLSDKQRLVRYQFVRSDATSEEIMADIKDGTNSSMAEVTMFAVDGTIKSLWFAAESCIRQSGTHHMYIEDFEVQEDGSLLLITGS